VKSFTAADAVGGTYTVTESYQGLKTHLQGRGLEGFASRTETDGRNGIQTKYLYYQAFPFIGNINSVTVSQPNGKTIVQTTTTYSDLQTSTAAFNDRHYPFVGNRVDKKYEVSSTASVDGLAIAQTTTTTVIDSYGNPTNITSTVADQTGSGLSYVTQTTNTPVNDTANWCLGFVTQQQVTSTVPNLPAQTRTVQFVQDTTVPRACRPAQKIVEPASTAWKVTTAYQYDTFGHENWQKVTATGIADRISTTDYGTQGVFPVGVTNAAGESATKTYDYALGVPLTAKDANLINVSWQYDGFGRKTLESRFDGTSTRWWLYACSATSSFCGDSLARYEILEQQFDNTGVGVIRSQATVYDGFARPLYVESQSLSGSMSVVATKYDNLGRVQTRTQPYFAGSTAYSTVYTYDLLGRPLLEKQPTNAADATTTYPYCAVCRTTQYGYSQLTHTVTDANTHVTKSISDATGQIVQVVDPALGNTYYTYDQFGNVLTVMDPKSNTITNTYNIRGFKMSAADPDMGTWSFDYYPTGELKTQTDAKGQVATFVFDGVSRMLTRTEPEGTTTFTYGSNSSIKNVGKLQSISAPGGVSQTFTFDSTGRPQDTTTTIDGTSYVVSNSYEPATGLLSTVTYPASTTAVPGSRFKVQYEYNYGLLADVKDANSGTVYWTNLATDPAGRTITEQFGNGLNSYTTYDLANGAMQTRFTGNSNQIQNLTYQWDKVGNLTERKDATLTMTEDFAYDSLNRMWQVKLNNSVSSTISYDTNGNILSKTGVGSYDYTTQQSGCSYTGLTAQPHAVRNAGGAVYCYDANGNAIKRAGSTISWTSYNLPSLINQGANSAQFFYDANRARYKQISVTAAGGNLPAGTETTVYVGALFEKVTKPSGVIEYKHYIKAGSESVAIRTLRSNSANDTRYLHKDHLGGIDTVTDEAGSIVLKMSFDAFGLRRNPASWSGNPSPSDWSNIAAMTHRGFTGHEMLDNVGLVHMNGRVYDPTIGRFLSADPNIQAPFLSQSLNRYSYVMNNPLSYADPTGYFLGGFFHSLFRFLNAFSRFLILPTAGHFFEAVKAQPGQRQVDQFIVSHKWAYQIGEVAASIATSWGYGFGGAVWASYYTYVQTGSEWKAAKVGAIVMAANYVLKNLADGIKEGVNDWANEHGQWYLVSQGAGEPVPLEGPIGGYKIFVNGMLNDLKLAASNALQQSGESEVELFYNPTHGFIADLTESVLMKVTGSSSLGNQLAEALANTPGISEIFAHSQGSLVVSNAMGVLAQEGFHFTADFGVVYFGNAANNMVARELANKIGASFVGGFSHEFDLVGNVVGMNTLNPIKIIGSILRAPTLMMGPAWSPHSLYLYSEIK
jgi:RHS repeat-associated protein